eukprot:7135985-Pyramimonas_sp.AAC.1
MRILAALAARPTGLRVHVLTSQAKESPPCSAGANLVLDRRSVLFVCRPARGHSTLAGMAALTDKRKARNVLRERDT